MNTYLPKANISRIEGYKKLIKYASRHRYSIFSTPSMISSSIIYANGFLIEM